MTRKTGTTGPLAWDHAVRDIPDQGLSAVRQATPDELASIARALDLVACTSLRADYKVSADAGRTLPSHRPPARRGQPKLRRDAGAGRQHHRGGLRGRVLAAGGHAGARERRGRHGRGARAGADRRRPDRGRPRGRSRAWRQRSIRFRASPAPSSIGSPPRPRTAPRTSPRAPSPCSRISRPKTEADRAVQHVQGWISAATGSGESVCLAAATGYGRSVLGATAVETGAGPTGGRASHATAVDKGSWQHREPSRSTPWGETQALPSSCPAQPSRCSAIRASGFCFSATKPASRLHLQEQPGTHRALAHHPHRRGGGDAR